MARHVLKTTATLFAVALFSSCAAGGPILTVLRGNLAYGRGDYQGALVHYMASEQANRSGWVTFNMGNVYYALGEQEAALAAWEMARSLVAGADQTERREPTRSETALIHAASYNRGVLFYELGQFQDAYDEFRYALSVRSTSQAAKANLELALIRLRSAEAAQGEGMAQGNGPAEGDQQTLRILEYVRRKEAEQWYANREIHEADNQRDW
jgi:tetratricopeptide (TPR) repeat protein